MHLVPQIYFSLALVFIIGPLCYLKKRQDSSTDIIMILLVIIIFGFCCLVWGLNSYEKYYLLENFRILERIK